MKKSIYIYLYISLTISLNGQVINNQELDKGTSIQRNTLFNLDEIKVRWKKAALDNCPGVPCPSFTCGTSTVSDVDGNAYNTVLIGTQCWTMTNLKVTKYNDGTLIGDSTNSTWTTGGHTWTGGMIGARTENKESGVPPSTSVSGYVETFGYLYNWYAVNDSRKLCPDGWHVPTDSDWNKLVVSIDSGADTTSTSLGEGNFAGTAMKSRTTNPSWDSGLGWNPATPPSPGTNTSGFSALPGGFRDGGFASIRNLTYFWSATEIDNFTAWYRTLYLNRVYLYRYPHGRPKSFGASVRCLRDN